MPVHIPPTPALLRLMLKKPKRIKINIINITVAFIAVAVGSIFAFFGPVRMRLDVRKKKMQGWTAEGEERAKLPSPVLSKVSVKPIQMSSKKVHFF